MRERESFLADTSISTPLRADRRIRHPALTHCVPRSGPQHALKHRFKIYFFQFICLPLLFVTIFSGQLFSLKIIGTGLTHSCPGARLVRVLSLAINISPNNGLINMVSIAKMDLQCPANPF